MQQKTRSIYAIVRQMEHFYLRIIQNTGMLAFSDITRPDTNSSPSTEEHPN